MEVAKDRVVILEYTVKLEDGSFVKGDHGPASLNFVVGYSQVLPALERRLIGVDEGAEIDFVISASEAFGEYNEDQVRSRTFSEFPEGRNLEVGKWVIASDRRLEAQYSYLVKAKTEDSVVLDFNHPLAGKDLYYHVKVVSVREALPEELDYLRPCRHQDEGDSPSFQVS